MEAQDSGVSGSEISLTKVCNRKQASQPAGSLCRGGVCRTPYLLAPPFYVPNSPCSSFQHGQKRGNIRNVISGELEVGSPGE